MLRRAVVRASIAGFGISILATGACSLVDGLNSLQEVACVAACGAEAGEPAEVGTPDASGGGADAGQESDTGPRQDAEAGAGPGADGSAPADGSVPADGSSDGGDGGDAGTALAYLGCFADGQDRDLPDQAYDDSANTPVRCIATCTDAGYAFAATQNGTQCFCGNGYGGQGPSGGCILACSGDASVVCGGQFANSVYATSTPPPAAPFIGCFNDNATRDLPYGAYESDFNTTAACVAACTYHGYLYAGTQYSRQCFCGDAYGAYGSSSSCIDPCSGGPSEICGGTGVNSIYRTSVTDAGAEAGPDDGG